jgi:hypothetical protein
VGPAITSSRSVASFRPVNKNRAFSCKPVAPNLTQKSTKRSAILTRRPVSGETHRLRRRQPDQKHALDVLASRRRTTAFCRPKLTTLMDESEAGRRAYMAFPSQRRTKLRNANPLGHLNMEVKRRVEAVRILPDEDRIIRPIGCAVFNRTTIGKAGNVT